VRFIPVTPEQQALMLDAIGVPSADALFEVIPPAARSRALDLPGPLTEMELAGTLRTMAARDLDSSEIVSFLGAGCYDHFVPAIVDAVVSKPEFFTAYTPYQPEISQGTLQAAYEYQSHICMMTGMDVSNASMYDGATAFAEAALMAVRATGRRRVVVSSTVHPEWRDVLATYATAGGVGVTTAPAAGGVTAAEGLAGLLEDSAALLVADPDFFGNLEPLHALGEAAHAAGALFVVAANPILLGVLAPPSQAAADVVVGEGQPLGNAMSFGGPGFGFFATTQEHVRRMPGRIVGRTVDHDGRPAFVLTMQTREQHIRREKATSNICSNHALNALAAGVYLDALGPEGLAEVGRASVAKAHYLREALLSTGRFSAAWECPFANEFAVRFEGDVESMQAALLEKGYLAGLDLARFSGDWTGIVLFAVTEKRTRAEMDCLVGEVRAL
jgi:glycine dehydrogenase subunit 1